MAHPGARKQRKEKNSPASGEFGGIGFIFILLGSFAYLHFTRRAQAASDPGSIFLPYKEESALLHITPTLWHGIIGAVSLREQSRAARRATAWVRLLAPSLP
jgi:hypothetical protein